MFFSPGARAAGGGSGLGILSKGVIRGIWVIEGA